MQLRNCPKCGKLFMYVSKRICPDCQQAIEEDFERIRIHVKANPGATVAEISEALEVEQETVVEFVRQGRSDVMVSGVSVRCERCGDEIRLGRYCERCAAELDRELQTAASGTSEGKLKNGPRMFIHDVVLSDDRNNRK